MADDGEELDWGGEEDEHYDGLSRYNNVRDVEDTVSIGGEEDDMQELEAFQSRTLHDRTEESQEPDVPPQSHNAASEKEASQGVLQDASTHENSPPPASRSDSQKSPLKHALPPKPVGAGPPPSFRGRTKSNLSPMRGNDRDGPNRRRDRERDGERDKDRDRDFDFQRDRGRERVNGSGRPPAPIVSDQLPPGWEIRRPRDPEKADNVYYFNIHTEESTWERPSWPDDSFIGKGRPLSPQSKSRDRRAVLPPNTDPSLTRNLDGARQGRYGDAQSFRGRLQEHLPELSRDDRHYRPGDEVSRGPSRSPPRRRTSDRPPPSIQTQGGMRDNLIVEPADPHARRGRSPPHSYSLPHAIDQSRSAGQRRDVDNPPFSNSKDPLRGRDLGPTIKGVDRGWASKREQIHSRRAEDDGSARSLKIDTNIESRDDNRRPLLQEAVSHQRRMLSSRSPPPHRARDADAYRARVDSPPPREPLAVRDSTHMRDRNDRPIRNDESWNITLRDRRGPPSSISEVGPIRRVSPSADRRSGSFSRSFSTTYPDDNTAKRRRVEEKTADSSQARRARSPSPHDRPRNSYSSSRRTEDIDNHDRAYSYNIDKWEPGLSVARDRDYKDDNGTANRSRDTIEAPRWPARDRDRKFGSTQEGVPPSGPRIKSRESFGDSAGYQGATSYGHQPPARPAYSQSSAPLHRRDPDSRRAEDSRSYNMSSEHAMDVDVPTGPKNDKIVEAAYGRSGMYNDRYTGSASREKEDVLPTGPRAMTSRLAAPPSPMNSTPSSGWRHSNALASITSSNVTEPRDIPRNPRRISRFDQPMSSRAEDFPQTPLDRADSSFSNTRQHGSPGAKQLDLPFRPDDSQPSTFARRSRPDPGMLSDANTIPVRGGKSWTVSSKTVDDRESGRNEVNRARETDQKAARGRHEHVVHPRVSMEKLMSMDDSSKVTASLRETVVALKLDQPPDPRDYDPLGFMTNRSEVKDVRRSGPRASRFGDRSFENRAALDDPNAPRTWTPRGEVPNVGYNQRAEHEDGRPPSPPPKSTDSGHSGPSPNERQSSRGLSPLADRLGRKQSPQGSRSYGPRAGFSGAIQRQESDLQEIRSRSTFETTSIPRVPDREVDTTIEEIESSSRQSMNDQFDPVHPSRRSQIIVPSDSLGKRESRPLTPPMRPGDGEGPRIVRIKRPGIKAEVPQVNVPIEDVKTDADRTKPPLPRANSLLDRISMNSDSPVGKVSLQDRVAPPHRWKDETLIKEPVTIADRIHGEGAQVTAADDTSHSRRNQGRPRTRGNYGGRPRRGRGRG